DADARGVVGAAEILELGRVEQAGPALVQQRPDDRPGKHRADHRAVLGYDTVEIRGGARAARALHVFRDDGGIAGDETVEMPGDGPGIDVVAAADLAADEKVDGPARVEVGGRRRNGGDEHRSRGHDDAGTQPRTLETHCRLPGTPRARSLGCSL